MIVFQMWIYLFVFIIQSFIFDLLNQIRKIEELTTEEIIQRINDGHLDAAIVSTPLENETINKKNLIDKFGYPSIETRNIDKEFFGEYYKYEDWNGIKWKKTEPNNGGCW